MRYRTHEYFFPSHDPESGFSKGSTLFKDVAVYNQQILGTGHVRALVDTGCRAARSLRGVAHITCPVDLQDQAVSDDEPSAKKVEGHTSDAWQPPIVVPRAEEVRAAADVLNAGKKTVILAGQGALGAGAELEQLADLLGTPIVKPLLGKGTVPDERMKKAAATSSQTWACPIRHRTCSRLA